MGSSRLDADDPAATPAIHTERELEALPVNVDPVEKFREFLELKRLKITGERLQIVEHVFEKHNHFEADQLLASMQQRGHRVSRSTVYRTLGLLVESGLLRELRFGGSIAYEHDYGYPQHEHLFCERCGAVIEFQSEELAEIQAAICQKLRFRPTHRQFIIHGVCEPCARKRSRSRKLDLI